MPLHNRPRHNTDILLLCQRPIFVEVQFPLIAEVAEFGVVGYPVREMVFGEYSKLRAARDGVGDELGGAGVVGGGLHGLQGSECRVAGRRGEVRTLGWSWMTAILYMGAMAAVWYSCGF